MKLTNISKQVMELAEEEAQRVGLGYLGTEHILLGLIRCDAGIASKILEGFGVTEATARQVIESVLGRPQPPPGS